MPEEQLASQTFSNPPQNPSTTPGQAKQDVGEVAYNVEFNDSLLSTQTWNNPRYDGCQTETQNINKFTVGDITYGKTAATQRYTRNIYLGETITPATSSVSELNDNIPFFTPFSGFSYVISKEYITINDDDTVEKITFDNTSTGVNNRNGYYRSFTEDFGIGTNCSLLILDNNIQNNLQDEYNIYLTGGRLSQILYHNNGSGSFADSLPQIASLGSFTKIFKFNGAAGITNGPEWIIRNNPDVVKINSSISSGVYTGTGSINTFMNDIKSNMDSSPYNRYFLTVASASGNTVQYNSSVNYTSRDDEPKTLFVPPTVDKTPTATATFEIQKIVAPGTGVNDDFVVFSNKLTPAAGTNILGVDYYISKFNDDVPAILLDLNYNSELPNGLTPGNVVNTDGTINFEALPGFSGPKFVIIPDNLHPYLKDNLNYFLNQAGLLDSTQPFTINPKNRQLS